MSVTSCECHHQNLWKKSCRFKTWTEIVRQILIKWETSPIGVFLVSQLNILEVPLGVIKANNSEPLGDHWIIHRTLEKGALWRWGKLNAMHVTLKFDEWPWNSIRPLFYTMSSFVHHFKAIGEFNWSYSPETLNSGQNCPFSVPCDLEIWWRILEKQ